MPHQSRHVNALTRPNLTLTVSKPSHTLKNHSREEKQAGTLQVGEGESCTVPACGKAAMGPARPLPQLSVNGCGTLQNKNMSVHFSEHPDILSPGVVSLF